MSTTVSGPPRLRRPPSRWARFRSSPHRTRWINAGLAVLLLIAAVGAYLLVGNPTAPQQVERTAVVTRGAVTASVTGSGNAASQVSTPISFESSGVVKRRERQAGRHGHAGRGAGHDRSRLGAGRSARPRRLSSTGPRPRWRRHSPGPRRSRLSRTRSPSRPRSRRSTPPRSSWTRPTSRRTSTTRAPRTPSPPRSGSSASTRRRRARRRRPARTARARNSLSSILGGQPKSRSGSDTSCNSKDANLAANRAALTTAQNNQRNTALADERRSSAVTAPRSSGRRCSSTASTTPSRCCSRPRGAPDPRTRTTG